MSRHEPFKAGDPKTKEYAKRGGVVAAEARRAKASASPTTQGLLGHLLTYSTAQWMDRLGLTGESWAAWRVIGQVIDGLPLSAEEMVIYTTLTGRRTVPTGLRECWNLAGRGSGKTSFMAVCGVKASCRGYAGVRGIPRVLLLAFVKEQAGVAFEYCESMFDGDPELRRLITRRTADSLTLAHGVKLQTIVGDYRSVRAYSVACALLDEVAHWWLDATAANPDVEIVRALRPGLGKVPGSRLLAATTRWIEEGQAYEVHKRHYANDASQNILVVDAPTLTLNPSFDATTIAIAEGEDPESAASEFGQAWRVAGGTLVHPSAYDACVDKDVFELEPDPELIGDDFYTCSVDLSGGLGQDSAALCIGHVEEEEGEADEFVQDFITEILPPFDPGQMCAEFAAHCLRFGISEVVGDQFSEGFAASEFRRHGILYTVSERKTAEVVLDSLAVINTGRARFLDNAKLRKQYLNLRRDYASGGRPTILETRKHDDLAVCTARAISAALNLGVEIEVRKRVMFGSS